MSAEGSGLVPGDHPDRIRWNAKYGADFVPSFRPHPLAVRALDAVLPAARGVPPAGRARVPPAARLRRAGSGRGARPRPPPSPGPPGPAIDFWTGSGGLGGGWAVVLGPLGDVAALDGGGHEVRE